MKKLLTVFILTLSFIGFAQQPVGVMVTGDGSVKVTPDEVLIKVRVEHDGASAEEVKSATDKGVNNILQFLKKERIADKYIQTEYIRLGKNYDYTTKTYKYNANQAISIKLTNIKDYEDIMGGLMKSGINRIDGIEFLSSEIEKYKSQARIKAINNAKKKAEEYASALGQKIGGATLISETGNSNIQPMYKTMMMSEARSDAGQQTIAIGEMEVEAQVNVTFGLFLTD